MFNIKSRIMESKTVYSEIFKDKDLEENKAPFELVKALYNRFGDTSLTDCGIYNSFYEALGMWEIEQRHLSEFDECSNSKFTGWSVKVIGNYSQDVKIARPYIPNWVLKVKVENYTHAKNLFHKYLKFATEVAVEY